MKIVTELSGLKETVRYYTQKAEGRPDSIWAKELPKLKERLAKLEAK